jgi:hypothetical protein
MRRVHIAQEEFFAFASSIFESLMSLSGNICLTPFLCLAEELIKFSLVPGENGRALDQPFESSEEEYANDLMKIPICQYESIGNFMLKHSENDDIMFGSTLFFHAGENLAFEEKKRFKKPTARKLLYLHRVFEEGVSKFQSLMNDLPNLSPSVEEFQGDVRYLSRLFPVKVYASNIYAMPSLTWEEMLCIIPRAFWLSLQGTDASQFLSENQCSLHKGGDSSKSSSVANKDSMGTATRAMNVSYNVPDNPEMAIRYVEIFEANELCSLALDCGILALKYYMNERKYEESDALLRSIVPALCELSDYSELTPKFFRLIDCSSRLLYQEDAVKEIILRAKNRHNSSSIATEAVEGDQQSEFLSGEHEVEQNAYIMNPTTSSGLELKTMMDLAHKMKAMSFSDRLSEFEQQYGNWNRYIETVIERSQRMESQYISILSLTSQDAEGWREEVVPCIFISGNVITVFRIDFSGGWGDFTISDSDFTEVFRNIACYGFSCKNEEDAVAHPERVACLHVLSLTRDYFRGATSAVITIYTVHRPCRDCLNFLNTKFCTRDVGIEKRKQFCLQEEKDFSENFADFLCERFKCPISIILKSVNRADITIIPRKRHDIGQRDIFVDE